MLPPEMLAQGWLPHDGGPCPVPPLSLVVVLFRDGGKSHKLPAKEFSVGIDWWGHEGATRNHVVAYLPDPAKYEFGPPSEGDASHDR